MKVIGMTRSAQRVLRAVLMKRVPLFLMFLLAATAARAAEPRLPLVEVPATRGTSDTFVVMVSGDGGWAKIDKALAAVLADNGMPTVGINALQYFWKKRTPDEASRDLRSVIDSYAAKWGRRRVVLAGYSRGADVLPAMAARLPAELQARVRLVALLAPSPNAQFEFHMLDWVRDADKGLPVRPELDRLGGRPVLCIWGTDDKESLCRGLHLPNVKVVALPGAHHFDGSYEQLARLILDHLRMDGAK
jgi:type IV secretory pathway VirJ component